VCNHCDREFGMNTSTTSLRYHLEREHEEHDVDEGRHFSAKKADMLVARFVVNNCLSLRTTTSSDFTALVGYLRRGYKPPGKDRLRDTMAIKMRTRMVEVMRGKMKTIDHYSATLDSWTSPACRPYITVTLHGATAAFKMESFMLGLVPVKASETAALIAQVVEDEIHEWGIDRSKIIGLTSDGARNMSSAITTHLRIEWIYCLAHVINLCVRLALRLPNVKTVVKAAKAICRTFKASSVAKRALEERQTELGLPVRSLKVDNKTRWGSTYEMLKRLTASRPAVSACLATLHGLRKPVPDDLTSAQWSLIEKMADVLEPFQDVTEFLSHEKHPTIGAVMPIMLGTIPAHLKVVTADGPTIKAFKKRLAKEIDIRWDILNVNAPETLLLAVYLDPRFKDFRFIVDAEEREICVRRAVDAIAKLVKGMATGGPSHATNSANADDEVSSYVAKRNRLFGEAAMSYSPPSTDADDQNTEVERYRRKSACAAFGDPSAPNEPSPMLDPLVWWKQRQSKFPRLAALARRYLSITCTSVPSERVFSKCGWIVNKRRCSLSDKNIALLAFLSCNQSHLLQE